MTLGGGLSRIASNDVKYVFGAPHFYHKNKVASHAYRPGEYFRRYQAEAIANGHQSDENNVEDCNVSADVPITDHASAPAIWFGYLQLIGPQSLGSIVVVSLCVLLLIWV